MLVDFTALLPLELPDDEDGELGSVLGLAAAGLAALAAAGLAFATGFAPYADGHGSIIIAARMVKAVDQRMELDRLGFMAVLSNAKVTSGSSTARR